MNSNYVKGKLYLNVPYAEKDEAKALGAKFDGTIKKWYYEGNIYNYSKFAKWILKNTDEALIAYDYIYILESKRTCFKCHKETTVIALGIGEHISLYDDDEDIEIEFEESSSDHERIHIAWVEDEKDIPQKLLKYIKSHYSTKTAYSKTLQDDCFANHCEHCGVIQGNNYVFYEADTPFSPLPFDKSEYVRRMSQIKIKMIPIDSNLQLNWNVELFSDIEEDYFKYGQKTYLNLRTNREVHSITDDDYITYQELYEL